MRGYIRALMNRVVLALVKNLCVLKHEVMYNLMLDVHPLIYEGVYDLV